MKQFIKFGIVGISNTIISYIIYIICLYIIENFFAFFKYDYVICSVISFLLSVLWSFYWNNKYTFKSVEKRLIWKSLLKTYISYAFTGIILNNILLILLIQELGINKRVAPLINLIITVPINFLLNKYWAFNNSKTKSKRFPN
jgi:putative flippase GtrA